MTPIWFIHNLADVLVSGEDGYAMIEMLAPAGDQPPLHVHHEEDEGFYVLEGELSLWAARSTSSFARASSRTRPAACRTPTASSARSAPASS